MGLHLSVGVGPVRYSAPLASRSKQSGCTKIILFCIAAGAVIYTVGWPLFVFKDHPGGPKGFSGEPSKAARAPRDWNAKVALAEAERWDT